MPTLAPKPLLLLLLEVLLLLLLEVLLLLLLEVLLLEGKLLLLLLLLKLLLAELLLGELPLLLLQAHVVRRRALPDGARIGARIGLHGGHVLLRDPAHVHLWDV